MDIKLGLGSSIIGQYSVNEQGILTGLEAYKGQQVMLVLLPIPPRSKHAATVPNAPKAQTSARPQHAPAAAARPAAAKSAPQQAPAVAVKAGSGTARPQTPDAGQGQKRKPSVKIKQKKTEP